MCARVPFLGPVRPKDGEVSEIPISPWAPWGLGSGKDWLGVSLEPWPGLSPLSPQGHTLRSRPWGTSGDPESGSGPSPNPLCSLLTFNDFNAGAIKNKVLPLPRASLMWSGPR